VQTNTTLWGADCILFHNALATATIGANALTGSSAFPVLSQFVEQHELCLQNRLTFLILFEVKKIPGMFTLTAPE
jgi:hypothetical protein